MRRMPEHRSIDSSEGSRWLAPLRRWFDTESSRLAQDEVAADRIEWLRVLPFLGMHLMCLGVIWVGTSPVAIAVAAGLYVLRMFAITAFYHRYFSHRAFRTTRVMQFLFALLAATSVQRGPLWWAAHHRHHHRHADTEQDLHSPVTRGFFWSHVGWFLTRRGFVGDRSLVRDFERFPELRWLDRFDIVLPVLLAAALYVLGGWLEQHRPQWGTSAGQLLVWGFFVSTVALFHATVTINSLAHRWGRRRFETRDQSRNNGWLALLTFGEGWHNNHHRFPGSARQGFRWWELDLTYYLLLALSWLGLIWDLKQVPIDLTRRGAR
jgi:stearoyl-CoA desaturase (delta-9 desaturase)